MPQWDTFIPFRMNTYANSIQPGNWSIYVQPLYLLHSALALYYLNGNWTLRSALVLVAQLPVLGSSIGHSVQFVRIYPIVYMHIRQSGLAKFKIALSCPSCLLILSRHPSSAIPRVSLRYRNSTLDLVSSELIYNKGNAGSALATIWSWVVRCHKWSLFKHGVGNEMNEMKLLNIDIIGKCDRCRSFMRDSSSVALGIVLHLRNSFRMSYMRTCPNIVLNVCVTRL